MGATKWQEKFGGRGPLEGAGPTGKKLPNMQFCHFVPFSGQRVAQTFSNVGKLFTVFSTTYNVLYVCQVWPL